MSITINPLTRDASTPSTNSTSSSSDTSGVASITGGQVLGEQQFLQLLTTELSNQDPLDTSNQDPTQMVAELAQFSEVEGINNLQTGQSQMQASGMLGQTVSATVTNSTNHIQSTITGLVSSVNYTSSGVTVSITDPTTGATTSGVTLNQIQTVGNQASSSTGN